ncbi:MAG TPA: hypothetical protein VGW75_12900 [Solirubrobacteraceae bacterium]|jgi:hypothetical protein|nr:hypothetical protein [Solirubrobacteraceae bacterium]
MHIARTLTTLAATGALALGAAACGDDETETASGGTRTEQARPKPAAQIDRLTGQVTAVKLDAGFVDALGKLKLTPGMLGDGTLENGSAKFPITGGNVTYYKPGSVSPYVQGRIDHDGSGLSLTGGGKVVELTDFVVDPGRSVLTGTVTVDGKRAAKGAPLFFLDGRTLQPLRTTDDGRAVLEGTTVKLKDESAKLLNETFGVDALQGGFVVGVAKITVAAGA